MSSSALPVDALPPRILASAREVDPVPDPSSLALLIACVGAAEGELYTLLQGMLLDDQKLRQDREALDRFEDRSASDVARRAQARADGAVGVADLIVATALVASPRVVAALGAQALTAPELAAQVAEWQLRPDPTPDSSRRVLATSMFAVLFSALTSVALALTVIHDGKPWPLLLLIPPTWWGYPREGPVFGFLLALLLAWLVGPEVGALLAVGTLCEIAGADAERLRTWSRTGVHLSLRRQRYLRQRAINTRGLRMSAARQVLRMRLRVLLPWPAGVR